MKNVKVVIGANYGDEGKGLMTRHFVLDAKKNKDTPIVVFHNGTAQRGHTVDYNPDFRHIYHHFGSGTGDGAPTFFAKTFLIHPMEFHREWIELARTGLTPPPSYADPEALVITPFDMLVDRATEEHIALINGEREFGSCGFGSWCAVEDRFPMNRTNFTIKDFTNEEAIDFMLDEIWKDCLAILTKRGVDLERTSYAGILKDRSHIVANFKADLHFFYLRTNLMPFSTIWKENNTIIFENGQGLGLDKDVNNIWHTTSKTGIYNPYEMLKNYSDFDAEVCYVSRSYTTRHGLGPLSEETHKVNITSGIDRTNVFNDFQGGLRYAYWQDQEQKERIAHDLLTIEGDKRFHKTLSITHCNEFDCEHEGDYRSDSAYSVAKNC